MELTGMAIRIRLHQRTSLKFHSDQSEHNMTLKQIHLSRNEIMIFTTLSLLSTFWVLLQQMPEQVGELQQLKDQVSNFVIIGLLAVLGAIIWRWVDAVNENTKAQRTLTQSMLDMTTRHDEKIKAHDDKFEQLTNDVHEIKSGFNSFKTEIKSEINKTVNDAIENHKDL